MNFEHLKNRSLIEISGEGAETFLDNIVTCKVVELAKGEASFGALLTPQGKILFDFFLIKTDKGYLIDVLEPLMEDFIKRLTFYRLRAKVSIEPQPDLNVYAIWDDSPRSSSLTIQDPRLAEMGSRIYSAQTPEGKEADYTHHRISMGIPQGGSDFDYGDAYPHEVLMDQFGGIDFKKGCYVGQEVISRMQHRGTAKKRVIMVMAEDTLPSPGTAITADGKPAGTLGSVSGNQGLALLRLDRVAKAEKLLAEKTELQTKIQNWVNFTMPEIA